MMALIIKKFLKTMSIVHEAEKLCVLEYKRCFWILNTYQRELHNRAKSHTGHSYYMPSRHTLWMFLWTKRHANALNYM